MLYAKFVKKDGTSPGAFGSINYLPFGKVVEVDAADVSEGHCAAGIHAIPLQENIEFTKVIFTQRMIILSAEPGDVVFQEGNGKVRLKKVTSLRDATEDECAMVRNATLRNPNISYSYASKVDNTPRNEARECACVSAKHAYDYALNIDRSPHEETRDAVLGDPKISFQYAMYIDKCPRDDTRKSALKDPISAYRYVRFLDKFSRIRTKPAAHS